MWIGGNVRMVWQRITYEQNMQKRHSREPHPPPSFPPPRLREAAAPRAAVPGRELRLLGQPRGVSGWLVGWSGWSVGRLVGWSIQSGWSVGQTFKSRDRRPNTSFKQHSPTTQPTNHNQRISNNQHRNQPTPPPQLPLPRPRVWHRLRLQGGAGGAQRRGQVDAAEAHHGCVLFITISSYVTALRACV
jgi:hypothetical protein